MRNILIRTSLLSCAAILALVSTNAQAQQSSGDAMSKGMTSGSILDGLQTGQQLLGSAGNPFTAKAAQSKAPPVTFVSDPSVDTAAKLASTYPAAKRQEVANVFREMLGSMAGLSSNMACPKMIWPALWLSSS
jgi:hypothetical protein